MWWALRPGLPSAVWRPARRRRPKLRPRPWARAGRAWWVVRPRSPRLRRDRGLCRARRLRAELQAGIVYGTRSAGILVDLYAGYQLDGRAFAWAVGIFPPPKSPFPPIERPGRAGYGTRNKAGRTSRPTPGMLFGSHFIAQAPTSVAQRCPTPSVSGRLTRGQTPNAWRRRSRLVWTFRLSAFRQGSSSGPCRRRHRAVGSHSIHRPGTTTWFGWCFVKCPGSYRRDGTPCPDGARCLRPVNYPPLLGGPMSTTSAPGAPHHRPGSDSPTKAVALCRLGRHLPLRLGRVVSEFLYFAAWAGLAPSPGFCGIPSRLVRGGKREWSHASAAECGPRPTPPLRVGSQVQAHRLSARGSSQGSFAELVALAERAGQSESLRGPQQSPGWRPTPTAWLRRGSRRSPWRPCWRPRRLLRRSLTLRWRRPGRHDRICRSAGMPPGPR